jgi:hypothetical protein
MFSSCARESVSEGLAPKPAWQAEHPFVITSPREFLIAPIQFAAGAVQKSLIVFIFPKSLPFELTSAGVWPFHW